MTRVDNFQTFPAILTMELGSSSFQNKHFYRLSHLAESNSSNFLHCLPAGTSGGALVMSLDVLSEVGYGGVWEHRRQACPLFCFGC